MWGLLFYGVTMALLTYWDEKVLPGLQDDGLMPVIPGSYEDRKRNRKRVQAVPWVTPVTADRAVPLPSLDELMQKAHRVGASNGVVQYIRAHARQASSQLGKHGEVLMELAAKPPFTVPEPVPIPVSRDGDDLITDDLGVCRLSPEFTEAYGHNIYICKREL